MERLASIETTLDHLATREQVSSLAEKIKHIEDRMPELTGNTTRADKTEGWRDAKNDTDSDRRSFWAIIISALAAGISILAFDWWPRQ